MRRHRRQGPRATAPAAASCRDRSARRTAALPPSMATAMSRRGSGHARGSGGVSRDIEAWLCRCVVVDGAVSTARGFHAPLDACPRKASRGSSRCVTNVRGDAIAHPRAGPPASRASIFTCSRCATDEREPNLDRAGPALARGRRRHYAPADFRWCPPPTGICTRRTGGVRIGATRQDIAGWIDRDTAEQSRQQPQSREPLQVATRSARASSMPASDPPAPCHIPWQNVATPVSVATVNPGGTACPPVHRNGARDGCLIPRVQHAGGRQ